MAYYDDVIKKLRDLANAIEKDEDVIIDHDGKKTYNAKALVFDLPLSDYSLPPPDPYKELKKAHKAGHRMFLRCKNGGLISIEPDWSCSPYDYCWIEKTWIERNPLLRSKPE